ncbi:MAG: cytochrome c oxidase cbb3-type subunit [Acidimicrobiaceae bacterium]|jgi:mono/diheme cytochrome c family protein
MLKRAVAVVEVIAVAGFVIMVALLLVKQPTKHLTALPPRTTVPAGQTGTTAPPDGAQLYKSSCAGCHGGDGGGGIGPQLRDGAVTSSFKDAASEVSFVKSGAGGMPAFRDEMSDAEIQAVVDFTRTTLQAK